jgi:hypothetical protein
MRAIRLLMIGAAQVCGRWVSRDACPLEVSRTAEVQIDAPPIIIIIEPALGRKHRYRQGLSLDLGRIVARLIRFFGDFDVGE